LKISKLETKIEIC